jgi:hypothetical protein
MISVRKVRGLDGTLKLQMRLDLGLLQMELIGRPDGTRPYGHESLLDYFQADLDKYKQHNGTELGFQLTPEQCQLLRDEVAMYYHRYLSLFVLQDHHGVMRDTAHNLRVLDLCSQFAAQDEDRVILEEDRPHIIVSNTRAAASILLGQLRFTQALQQVNQGLHKLRQFFIDLGEEKFFRFSHEAKILRRFARQIRKHLPRDPLRRLRSQLQRAIKDERYEDAARLRDQLQANSRIPA